MTAAGWRREIAALCDELGWVIERHNKHIKLSKPGVAPVFCSASPSCPFAIKKVRAMMLRAMNGTAHG